MTNPPPLLAADHIRHLIRGEVITNRVDRFTHDPNRKRWGGWTKTSAIHVVTHAPLLDQLEAAIQHGRGTDTPSGIHQSKPCGRLDALQTLQRIDKQSAAYAATLGVPPQPLRARLSAISGKIGATQDAKVRAWWVSARCITGWEEPAYQPHVPCPNLDCERWDTLRIRIHDAIGTCIECGTTWHGDQFPTLGDYIRWASEHLTGPRHWRYDDEGYPVECVDCLMERQAMADRACARRAAQTA